MTIIWRGGEDVDFSFTSNTQVTTTGGLFRSGYARCGIQPGNTGNGQALSKLPWNGGAGASSFWFSSQMTTNNINNTNGFVVLWFYDTGGVLRFYVVATGTNAYQVFKRTAAGVTTSLGTFSPPLASNTMYKWDIQVVGGASGNFNLWITQSGGTATQYVSFSGDTTTDGAAQNISQVAYGDGLSGQIAYTWSEGIASTTDTRSMSLVTLVPAANGNTHNFDTGTPAAANINETIINDTTLDGSSTAGQIDQYTINGLPTGAWLILDVAIVARMLSSGAPSKMDLGVRCGASPADFWSSDFTLTASFATYGYNWGTDPSTSAAWTALPVNIGLKSVT